jgi:hypothetical protein
MEKYGDGFHSDMLFYDPELLAIHAKLSNLMREFKITDAENDRGSNPDFEYPDIMTGEPDKRGEHQLN